MTFRPLAWGFDRTPAVEWLDHGGDSVRLKRPLVYTSLDGRVFKVPTGQVTDLASQPTLLPALLNWLLGDKLASAAAAILHDWLYRSDDHCGLSRAEADALFAEALEWLRLQQRRALPVWRRPFRWARDRAAVATFWLGVRICGWTAWRD